MTITNIEPQELKSMLENQPGLQLVDVRTPEEYLYLGHIPEARLMPLHELPYQFRNLDPAAPVVVTCQHGVRSVDACYFLQAQGFQNLYNLMEGMSSWGYPVERDVSLLENMIHPQPKGETT